MPSFFKEQVFRSRKYTDWVKQLPSALSGQPADDPHHIKGHGYGGGTKPSDLCTMPLTRVEHSELHAIGWQSWEEKYGVDQRDMIINTVNQAINEGVLVFDKDAVD